jgi:hypothetical protein
MGLNPHLKGTSSPVPPAFFKVFNFPTFKPPTLQKKPAVANNASTTGFKNLEEILET